MLHPVAHEILKPGLIVGPLPGHVFHVVIAAGLGDELAGGGGGLFAALWVDILGYLVRLLPRNVPSFFTGNI